jgi:hypothetical protein
MLNELLNTTSNSYSFYAYYFSWREYRAGGFWHTS